MPVNPEILRVIVFGMVVTLAIVVVVVSAWAGAHLVAKTFELTLAAVKAVLLKE